MWILTLLFNFTTVIVGEIANFAAYAFAPAILVTPLGALSIIIRHDKTQTLHLIIWILINIKINIQYCSAVLAHIILREKLHIFGILGCVLCVVGSTTIVLHAPQERPIESVTEVWGLATEPGNFLLFICDYFWTFLGKIHKSTMHFHHFIDLAT